MKNVKIILHNGVAEVFEQDKGTRVLIRDYDVEGQQDEYCKKDKSGAWYRDSIYEREGK